MANENEINQKAHIPYLVSFTLCILFICLASSCSYQSTIRANMIANGANPIDVMCMESYSRDIAVVCIERARQPK